MREDSTPLRGESGRIAARVRELVDDDFAARAPATRHAPLHDRPSPLTRLAALLPVRVDPGRRAPVAIGIGVLLAAVLTGLWVLSAKPRAVALSATAPAADGVSTSASGSSLVGAFPAVGSAPPSAAPTTVNTPSAAEVVVDVAGRVRRPGLYHLPAGSRVDDAISAAGGARRGVPLRNLNLAAVLVDGEQILVGPGSGAALAAPAAPPAAAGASSPAAPVPLNTASLEQLETLPGVGPVTAQKILDYRAAHGSFSAIDQLKDVSGIGDITFAELEPLVTL